MGKKIVIEGMDELRMKVKGISSRVALHLESAMLEGAGLIENEADSLAPGPDIAKETYEKKPERVVVQVGPKKAKWYWQFFETGATQHEIKAHKKKALFFEGASGPVLTGSVEHMGMAARPFLRPAFDRQKDAAVRLIGERLKAEIELETE